MRPIVRSSLGLTPALFAWGCSVDARTLHVARAQRDAGFHIVDPDTLSDATTPVAVNSTDADAGTTDSGTCLPDPRGGTACGDDIVVNGGFAKSVAPWAGDENVTVDFSPDDSTGKAGSGSATVQNASAGTGGAWSFAAASECLPALGRASYALAMTAFIASGQGSGGAGLGVTFYESADCTSTELASNDAPPTDKTDKWVSVGTALSAPEAARSLRVRLVVEKPLATGAFEVKFDDVQVVRDARVAAPSD